MYDININMNNNCTQLETKQLFCGLLSLSQELAIVSAMVGAGGTLGAVIATRLCYMTTEDDSEPTDRPPPAHCLT